MKFVNTDKRGMNNRLKKCFSFVVVFVFVSGARSMDYSDPEEALAIAASLESYESERQRGRQIQIEEDDEDLLDEAVQSSLVGLKERITQFPDLDQKGHETAQIFYAQILSLSGPEEHAEINNLFREVDYKRWKDVFHVLGIETPLTATDLVFFLDRFSGYCPADSDGLRIKSLSDDAILSLFSGCWGIQKDRAEPSIEARLKETLRHIGRSSHQHAHMDHNEFGQGIFTTLQENGYQNFVFRRYCPDFFEHFATVFQCLSEGYAAAAGHGIYPLLSNGMVQFRDCGVFNPKRVETYFENLGIYDPKRKWTFDDLIQLATMKNPTFKIHQVIGARLKRYLMGFTFDDPKISQCVPELHAFWSLLKSLVNTDTAYPECLKPLLFDAGKRFYGNDQTDSFFGLLWESITVYETKDVVSDYDASVEQAGEPKSSCFGDLYAWLLEIIRQFPDYKKDRGIDLEKCHRLIDYLIKKEKVPEDFKFPLLMMAWKDRM